MFIYPNIAIFWMVCIILYNEDVTDVFLLLDYCSTQQTQLTDIPWTLIIVSKPEVPQKDFTML